MNKKTDILNILAVVITSAVIVVMLWIYADANIMHFTRYREADAASSTLQAPLLYENGYRMPDTWCISTEHFIICPQNLAAFIYPLVGMNMNLSMGIACVLMMLILVGVMIFYLYQMRLSPVQIACTLLLSLTVASFAGEAHKMLYLYAGYYTVHYIIMFIVLGTYVRVLKHNRTAVVWLIILTYALSVVGGMQGMHISLFCLAPLCGSEIVRRIVLLIQKKKINKYDNLVTLWVLSLFAIAFSITEFTANYDLNPRRNIRHAGEKFIGVVYPEFSRILNFNEHPVWMTFFLAISVLTLIVLIIRLFRKHDPETQMENDIRVWGILPVVAGFFCTVFLTTFTTSQTSSRYFVMLVFIVSIGYSLYIPSERIGRFMWLLIVPVLIYSGIYAKEAFHNYVADDPSQGSSYSQIVEWMEEHRYEHGYSTFNNANTITVISNNRVKVRAVDNMYDLHGCKWLTDMSWYPPTKSSEGATVYIVVTDWQPDFDKFLDETAPGIIEQTAIGDYNIYVLDHDYTIWE